VRSYDTLSWSGASSGFATAGFNRGDGVTATSLHGSATPSVAQLSCRGSAAISGCYTFRIDGAAVLAGLAPALYSGGPADPCARSLAHLYPFGASSSDAVGPAQDDDVAVISWSGVPFYLYGTPVTSLFPSTNGLIGTRSNSAETFTPFPFVGDGTPSIAVWWADGATNQGRTVPAYGNAALDTLYWRVTTTPAGADAARIASDVALTFPSEPPFNPAVLVIVTWFGWASWVVDNALNTVQAALAADATGRSFVTLW
jgi:hypothetical protein